MSPVLIVLSVSSAVGVVLLIVAAQLSVHRWVRWARAAAAYGTTDILNAAYVDSEHAVSDLRAHFDAWSAIVKSGTAEFCRTGDAHQVQFFDVPSDSDFLAYNDEHRYIRHATAERVERLLDLATRVERGETRLRAYFVPRAERA